MFILGTFSGSIFKINGKVIPKSRGVFMTLSKIYDEAFLLKYLPGERSSRIMVRQGL